MPFAIYPLHLLVRYKSIKSTNQIAYQANRFILILNLIAKSLKKINKSIMNSKAKIQNIYVVYNRSKKSIVIALHFRKANRLQQSSSHSTPFHLNLPLLGCNISFQAATVSKNNQRYIYSVLPRYTCPRTYTSGPGRTLSLSLA